MSATVIVSFQAKPDQVERLLEFLSSLQTGLLEAGCLSVSPLQDQDDLTCCFEVEECASADEHQAVWKGNVFNIELKLRMYFCLLFNVIPRLMTIAFFMLSCRSNRTNSSLMV